VTDKDNVILVAKLAATLLAGDLGASSDDGYRYVAAGKLIAENGRGCANEDSSKASAELSALRQS